jgi:hypothetical protein
VVLKFTICSINMHDFCPFVTRLSLLVLAIYAKSSLELNRTCRDKTHVQELVRQRRAAPRGLIFSPTNWKMSTFSATTSPQEQDSSGSSSPLHVLLGVSGSVGAVKAPEIAVQLVRNERPCLVHVLLTKGGSIFWNKARHYNPLAWESLQVEIERQRVVVLGELS